VTALREADWSSARETARGVAERLPADTVPVEDLDGRVLAHDCVALCQLPSFDSSAMDGWALAGSGPWNVVGDVAAGHPWSEQLAPGTAVRIATGGVVPDGATSVLRWEAAHLVDGIVHGSTEHGADIRPAGEECQVGDLIASAGTQVGPALAGFLAATGHDAVSVIRRPRVALILLGDELLTSGVPQSGRVRDSLGPQLPGWISRAGGEVVSHRQVPDDLESVHQALFQAATEADLVITTGGTADGPRDHVHGAIDSLGGSLVIDRVAVRPGHPMLLATLGSRGRSVPLVGLPGNPHSAVVGFVTLAVPVVDALLGRTPAPRQTIHAQVELRAPEGHTRLIAGNVADGAFVLSPFGGSAMLRGLARSSGFAVVPEGATAANSPIEWLPLP